MTERIIGIDLGTTNSVVAAMEGGEPRVIVNPDGHRLTPSVVAFTESGERLVGQAARRQAVTNPTNTVYSIKRFMGRRHQEVADEEKQVSYKIVGAPEEPVKVEIRGKTYTPPEISAVILQYLRKAAEDHLGGEVKGAVITVPAYFNDAQRQATKDAGVIAGLSVERILNEPTAAALSFGVGSDKSGTIAIFDFGGGTYDISILELGEGVFEVKSTSGDTHLGGDDLDQVLLGYVAEEFQKETGIDIRQDTMALHRLREACERAKIDLSSAMQAEINLPFITADAAGPKHLTRTLSRAKFDQLIEPVVERLRGPSLQAMKDAKVSPSDLTDVLLVGGSTRIPLVQAIVKEIFEQDGNKSVNPDEAVALGAAVQGGILSGDENLKEMLLLDVTPLSLGVEVQGGLTHVLIPRNTTIPAKKAEVFSTASDSQPEVEVHVQQGERKTARDNRTLGKFNLQGIPPAPRGVPQIEVTFDIDANGILNVSALDKGTKKEQKIRIESSSGLSKEEVDQMQKEAEAHASEDEAFEKLALARNKADQMVYMVDKTVKEHGEKVGADVLSQIEARKKELEDIKESDDVEAIEKAIEGLETAVQEISKKVYEDMTAEQAEQQAAGATAGATASTGGGDAAGEAAGKDDEGVIDADFEVK